MKSIEKTITDLRGRADDLTRRADLLRETAEFLTKEYGLELDEDPGESSPKATPKATRAAPAEGSKKQVPCAGWDEGGSHTDCPQEALLDYKRGKTKNRRCLSCFRKHRNATARAKRRVVWNGEEGLSSGAPSSLDPNALPSTGA